MSAISEERPHADVAKDWDNLIGTLRRFSAKYQLPAPDLILNPAWKGVVATIGSPYYEMRLTRSSQSEYMGVKIRFGVLRTETVILG